MRFIFKFQVDTIRSSLFLEAAFVSKDPQHLAAVLRFLSDFLPGFRNTSEHNRYYRILNDMNTSVIVWGRFQLEKIRYYCIALYSPRISRFIWHQVSKICRRFGDIDSFFMLNNLLFFQIRSVGVWVDPIRPQSATNAIIQFGLSMLPMWYLIC